MRNIQIISILEKTILWRVNSDILRENTIKKKPGRSFIGFRNHMTPPFIHYDDSVMFQFKKPSKIKLKSLLCIIEIVKTLIILILHITLLPLLPLLPLLLDWYALREILPKSDTQIVSFGVLQTRQHTFHLCSEECLDEGWLERGVVAVDLAPSLVQSYHYLLRNRTIPLSIMYDAPLQVLPHEGLDVLRLRFHLLFALLRISWADESLCEVLQVLIGQRDSLKWMRLLLS